MRCADVTRELAVPTGAASTAEVERHLAACPPCAARAEAERRFDRLWESTRPSPPADAFEQIWSDVMAAVEAPIPAVNGPARSATPTLRTFEGIESQPRVATRPGANRLRRWGTIVTLVAVAQAASILLTALIVSRLASGGRDDRPTDPPGTEVASNPSNGNGPAPPVVIEPTAPPIPREAPIPTQHPVLAQVYDFELDDGQTLIFQLADDNERVVVHPRLIQMDDLVAFEGDFDEPIALAGAWQSDMNLLGAMEALDGPPSFLRTGTATPAPHDPETEPASAERESPESDPLPGTSATPPPRFLPLHAWMVPWLVGLSPMLGDPTEGAPDKPPRQVTVFGIVATPEETAIDPSLDASIIDDLRKFKPGHGFLLRGVTSRRLENGEDIVCDLGDATVARAELIDALDPATGKLRIRFTLEIDDRPSFTTTVTTPPNQLFFCEKPLGEGVVMLIGIGAR